jgi:hypothetical protein
MTNINEFTRRVNMIEEARETQGVTGHFTVVCADCEKVIETCRCAAPDKTKVFIVCDECEKIKSGYGHGV